MTDRKKPEELADTSLDEAQGGLVINLSVGVKEDVAPRPRTLSGDPSDRKFGSSAGSDPNV